MTMLHTELVKHSEGMLDTMLCSENQKDAVEEATREQTLSKF